MITSDDKDVKKLTKYLANLGLKMSINIMKCGLNKVKLLYTCINIPLKYILSL